MSRDIATEFGGRGDEVHMYPLSFSEFMSCYDGNKYDGWNEYITYGGIPLYIEYLEDAFLIEEANRYDIKGKSYIGTPLKYYFMDMGLRNSRIHYRNLARKLHPTTVGCEMNCTGWLFASLFVFSSFNVLTFVFVSSLAFNVFLEVFILVF